MKQFDFPALHKTWGKFLNSEFKKPYMQSLGHFLSSEDQFYPKQELLFNALNLTPLPKTSVVIIGQDPYHNPNQAMGLAFSVPANEKIPPSLKNIFLEIERDQSVLMPPFGDLTKWAKSGVLLLNTVLSVKRGEANSHQKKGWENFTQEIIKTISQHNKNIVFILWGKKAQKLSNLIDDKSHLILTANHPSPLSANRGGFFDCKHFSKTNRYLQQHSKKPIEWDNL